MELSPAQSGWVSDPAQSALDANFAKLAQYNEANRPPPEIKTYSIA